MMRGVGEKGMRNLGDRHRLENYFFLEGAGLTSRCRYSHIEPKNRNSGINIAINAPEMLGHNTRFSSYLNFSSSLITNV